MTEAIKLIYSGAVVALNTEMLNPDFFWHKIGQIMLVLFNNTNNRLITTIIALSDQIGIKEFNSVFSSDPESLSLFYLIRDLIQKLPAEIFEHFPHDCNTILQKILIMK